MHSGAATVAPDHLAKIREGMRSVTAERGGTAYRVWNEQGGRQLGFDVAGKSGTAQVPKQWKNHVDVDGTPWREILREGNMVWFAGFAPVDNPKVAFVAVVEYVLYQSGSDMEGFTDEGTVIGGGATVAGPLCVEALKACKELGYITAATSH